jgi:hypothetical protein
VAGEPGELGERLGPGRPVDLPSAGVIGGERGEHRPLQHGGVFGCADRLLGAGRCAAVGRDDLARRGDDPDRRVSDACEHGDDPPGLLGRDAVAVAVHRHQRRPGRLPDHGDHGWVGECRQPAERLRGADLCDRAIRPRPPVGDLDAPAPAGVGVLKILADRQPGGGPVLTGDGKLISS